MVQRRSKTAVYILTDPILRNEKRMYLRVKLDHKSMRLVYYYIVYICLLHACVRYGSSLAVYGDEGKRCEFR
jgi:hypothetical protein